MSTIFSVASFPSFSSISSFPFLLQVLPALLLFIYQSFRFVQEYDELLCVYLLDITISSLSLRHIRPSTHVLNTFSHNTGQKQRSSFLEYSASKFYTSQYQNFIKQRVCHSNRKTNISTWISTANICVCDKKYRLL